MFCGWPLSLRNNLFMLSSDQVYSMKLLKNTDDGIVYSILAYIFLLLPSFGHYVEMP